jgi:hypothetical protein
MVSPETNWLRDSGRQMKRCQGEKDILYVMGWCTIKGDAIDLDQASEKACFTEQQIQFFEEILGKKCYFTDFFKAF